METIKGNLDGSRRVDDNAVYLIDFTKITSVNDLVLILASIGFSFSPHHPQFQNLLPFLNLDNPIPVNRGPQVEAKEVKLPKLKTLK
jgi:hypothetical protein